NHEETISHLVDSIQRFGFKSPIVALTDRTILAGHGRYKAAKKLGMKAVPVVFVDMDPKDAEAFMLADNKVAEHSDWNTSLLVQLAQEQKKPIPGFTSDEIGSLLKAMHPAKKKDPPKVKGK